MPLKLNPLTGQFDLTGSGGGASYIDGEVATYNDLPLDGTAALNSAWLVRTASGVWPVSRKQAGIYIRTATAGSSRDADYTYAGTMPDVFSDSVFLLYDEANTTRTAQFNLGNITAGQNRVMTVPNKNITIADNADIPAASSSTPAALGTAAVGTGTTFARADHVHSADVSDSAFRVSDNGDSTKKVALECSSIGTGTTRTLTVPNLSGTIAVTSQLVDTQVFTANGTWTKPAGAKMIHFIVIGGGGGGGSGRRDSAGNNRCGGGGGGGGGISVGWLNESAFGATETITVGAGGAGGAARTVTANGLAGTSGGESSIGSVVTTFASTGGGGGAGTSSASGGGAINTARIYGPDGATGGGSAGRADAQPALPTTQFLGPSGGSGGGGISAANTVFTGNVGGQLGNARTSGIVLGGTFTASAAGGNGNSGGFNFTGSGGGGGSPDASTGAGNNGGNGALYGGGGGGGSGGTDPASSGKGGDGANGIVIITTYF
jgi:hypothetical protein